ncbi:MAG TPA: 3-deoxy-7-phosphoheptulonate synthase [Clostridiales bacterium]|nr:3-deoxy-7-phosphoheptulonate synthase [Clostridiales bacterium]
MIVIMKPGALPRERDAVIAVVKGYGMDVHVSEGQECTIIGIIGDTSKVDRERLEILPAVDRVMKVQEPYKKASRKFHPDNTVVDIQGVKFGSKRIVVIAGPCSVESLEQVTLIAQRVCSAGASMIRGGAYKPRTSPYSFQGLEETGLEYLKAAKRKSGLPVVSEIVSSRFLDSFIQNVDLIQIGARNMQNFDLLKEVGKTGKPVLLKRGPSSTIEEMLMSAEYILAGGNPNIILCERGIRTFENYTRFTLDLSAIPAIKRLSHLPVVVDPSHSSGMAWMVADLSRAAIAAGADGIMIEVHNDPANALCDGRQSITPDMFEELMPSLKAIASVVGREI